MTLSLPTSEELIKSASRYAQSALNSHASSEFDRLAIFAGLSLEHISKACIAKRHPALLLDLKHDSSWKSLKNILTDDESSIDKFRTISLENAIKRVRELFTSKAIHTDIDTLIELRNGAIHVALIPPLEERLLIAFLRQLDASLTDLKISKTDFWLSHLEIVETFLSLETDRVKRHVAIMLIQSKFNFEQKVGSYPHEVREMITKNLVTPKNDQESYLCVVCNSNGIAYGEHLTEYTTIQTDEENFEIDDVWVTFQPEAFRCEICGLALDSVEELEEAGFDTSRIDSDLGPGEVR